MGDRRTAIIRAVTLAAVVVGTALHAWWVFHTRLTGDQAIAGLMGREIRHGHLYTFYWGQAYGGAEPYVVAVVTLVGRTSGTVLNLVPTLLAALSAVLVWRVGRRIVPTGMEVVAGAAGAAVWLGPQVLTMTSSQELGFRGVTLAAGVGLVLAAQRAGTTWRPLDLAVLGLVAGVGWWSSPEIIYFALPALGGLVAGGRPDARAALLAAPAAFVVGAAPWIATNLRSGFASLDRSSSPSYVRSDYTGRLSVFLHKTLPMMLGFRLPQSGRWVWGTAGQVLCWLTVAAVVALTVLALAGAGPTRARWARRGLAAGVLAFPLLYAAFPATSYWQQGQYGVYLVPLVALTAAAAAAALREPDKTTIPDGRTVVAGLTALAVTGVGVLSLTGFHDLRSSDHLGGFLSGWGDQNRAQAAAARLLRAGGVRAAYAEYWVAYDLDYLSAGRLTVTDPYADRWVAAYQRVRRADRPAWLFFDPHDLAAARNAFRSTPPGPFGLPESVFLQRLGRLGVGYRVQRAGVLVAVVPDRSVAPAEVGIPPPYWR